MRIELLISHFDSTLFSKVIQAPQKAVAIFLSMLKALATKLGGIVQFTRKAEPITNREEPVVTKVEKIVIQTLPPPIVLEKVKEEKIEPLLVEVKKEEIVAPIVPKPKQKIVRRRKVKPKVEPQPLSKKRGWVVSVLGRERLDYWCPKMGALSGLLLGFYSANLAVNFGIFFATSKDAQATVFSESVEKLKPYINKCTACNISLMPVQGVSGLDTALLADIDVELQTVIDVNKVSFKVLSEVTQSLESAAARVANRSILSVDGIKTAATFAKEASHGDVPLNFLSITNGVGALAGAYGGYKLGQSVAAWLDS